MVLIYLEEIELVIKICGICDLVKSELFAKRRIDLELQNTVCIWVEIFIDHKKLRNGTFYRNTSSSNDPLILIQNVITRANDTNIRDILITGDLNLDILKHLVQNIRSLSVFWT